MPDIFIAPEKQDQKTFAALPEAGRRRGHALSSFCLYPEHANFFDRDPEEKVILLLRRHPITNVKWIIVSVILLTLPFLVTNLANFQFLPYRFYLVVLLGWFLVTFAYIFENFLSWFFNVNIVTDKRVIDVNFLNLVYREISDAEYREIQDVTVIVGSVLRTVFNFGDILIQTAAEISKIQFEAIPQPDRVDKILRELRVLEESNDK